MQSGRDRSAGWPREMLSASVSSSMLYSVSLHSGRLAGYLRDLRSRSAICNTTPLAGNFPTPERALGVIQIDHTKVDVILVDDLTRQPVGRPWITLAIDVFSRMIAGFYVSFDPPGAMSTGLCLAHAILLKSILLAKYGITTPWPICGRIQRLHLDNAKEFHGTMLDRACLNYGIELQWRQVKKPWYG